MSDETLDEVELRVEEAKRKLAWLKEEYRELQLSPVVRDFEKFYDKWEGLLTPEEKARRLEVIDSDEGKQVLLNKRNRLLARKELSAAERNLLEFKIKYNLYALEPIDKWNGDDGAGSDGESCLCLFLGVIFRRFSPHLQF